MNINKKKPSGTFIAKNLFHISPDISAQLPRRNDTNKTFRISKKKEGLVQIWKLSFNATNSLLKTKSHIHAGDQSA